jgi:hypothetical protein
VYVVEMLLKMRIYGLICDNGYLHSWWCLLEFIVVAAGLVDVVLRLVTGNPSLPYLRALRVLVVLRLGKVFEVGKANVRRLLHGVCPSWFALAPR